MTLRDSQTASKYSQVLDEAKAFIYDNYAKEEISLNTVAARVNISPSYFSSIFSQEMGVTFVEFLTGVRMEKAKELLMCSNLKTSEIGYEVGYKDSHYFGYLFKKTVGCTPKEYRREAGRVMTGNGGPGPAKRQDGANEKEQGIGKDWDTNHILDRLPLEKRLNLMTFIIIIPLAVLVIYLMATVAKFCNAYTQSIANITQANSVTANLRRMWTTACTALS